MRKLSLFILISIGICAFSGAANADVIDSGLGLDPINPPAQLNVELPRDQQKRSHDPASQLPPPKTNAPITSLSAQTDITLEAQDIKGAFDSPQSSCAQDLDKAKLCCGSPVQCLGESVGKNSGTANAVLSLLQTFAGVAAQQATLSGSCSQMQKVGMGVAVVNAALAYRCSQKIKQCTNSCGQLKARAEQVLAQCSQIGNKCAGTIQETAALRADMGQVVQAFTECKAQENSASEQVQQAIASAYTAKLAGLCSDASKTQTPEQLAAAAFNMDCTSSANASNPACQAQCARAGAETDPACNGANSGNGFGSADGGLVDPNGKSTLSDTGLDESEMAQNPTGAATTPTASKIATAQAGGPAGLGGGGEDQGGGLGTVPSGGGEGLGINVSSIGGSLRSGSGYTAPAGRSIASRGGATAIAPGGFKAGSAFNPKDYLPGGRLDPKRGLAGLASATAGIGAVHGDIFTNITNRFYQVCLRDGLYDCSTLRKSGTQGN